MSAELNKTIEVIRPGMQTTVQDYPGRMGYWDVGVPPSGPMDNLSFLLGNRILGNPDSAPGLEITLNGPALRFNTECILVMAGAPMVVKLNGAEIPYWKAMRVRAGSVLDIGHLEGPGLRAYLCIKGGFSVPEYLGSKSTFTLGKFGGHQGRELKAGDLLFIDEINTDPVRQIDDEIIPHYENNWEIRVLYGPHGAPDFFTTDDIAELFNTLWEVHYNSSRTGIRLIGPKPEWARLDGGEAGLHPSNIHDNAYAVGTIDYTGDMPVILGPDGPSLGGFVCPATIIKSDLWKTGQLKPGDRIRFVPIDLHHANELEEVQLREIATLVPALQPGITTGESSPAILDRIESSNERTEVCYRIAGEDNILVEYGPMVLDLNLRFRVHALMEWLKQKQIDGIIDLTPGIRSLQVHYDNRKLSTGDLMDYLVAAEQVLPCVENMEVPARIIHMPLSWNDPSTRRAVEIYMQSVRADAPWCPSNIEFIRRINGLDDIDQVKQIVFDASYLVMGLGDVYLGAPVATPLDPRHRLVTTKYNPARTWTPENAVGIGGAYLCVYGMEGPGGYQFVGRTIQVWNSRKITTEFEKGKPWLLRFFDQIRFFEVSEQELLEIREAFPAGEYRLNIEHENFKLSSYNAFLEKNRQEIDQFKARQQAAFEQERQRWSNITGTEDEVGSMGDNVISITKASK